MNPGIEYAGVCPHCGATAVKLKSTQRPRRFFKCTVCLQTFQTLEIVLSENWLENLIAEQLCQGRLDGFDFQTRRGVLAFCSRKRIAL